MAEENWVNVVEETLAKLESEPKNAELLLKLGEAYFQLEEYESSVERLKQALEAAKEANNDAAVSKAQLWIRKCNTHLEPGQAAQVEVKAEQAEAAPAAAPAEEAKPAEPPKPQVRHSWYQMGEHVTVEFFAKERKPEDYSVEIRPNEFHIRIHLPTGEEYDRVYHLFDEVVPEASRYSNTKMKIEIVLQKKNKGAQWKCLELEEAQAAVAKDDESVRVGPYSSKKNWAGVEESVKADTEADKPQGDAALQKLFQEIYSNASEETRRAMMKSFVESNGTVLSTNWDEVGKGKVECKAPTGMEEKKWQK